VVVRHLCHKRGWRDEELLAGLCPMTIRTEVVILLFLKTPSTSHGLSHSPPTHAARSEWWIAPAQAVDSDDRFVHVGGGAGRGHGRPVAQSLVGMAARKATVFSERRWSGLNREPQARRRPGLHN
jgi:hypothetical protein